MQEGIEPRRVFVKMLQFKTDDRKRARYVTYGDGKMYRRDLMGSDGLIAYIDKDTKEIYMRLVSEVYNKKVSRSARVDANNILWYVNRDIEKTGIKVVIYDHFDKIRGKVWFNDKLIENPMEFTKVGYIIHD